MIIFSHSRIINSDQNGATVGPDLQLDVYGNADKECFVSTNFFTHNLETSEVTSTITFIV